MLRRRKAHRKDSKPEHHEPTRMTGVTEILLGNPAATLLSRGLRLTSPPRAVLPRAARQSLLPHQPAPPAALHRGAGGQAPQETALYVHAKVDPSTWHHAFLISSMKCWYRRACSTQACHHSRAADAKGSSDQMVHRSHGRKMNH